MRSSPRSFYLSNCSADVDELCLRMLHYFAERLSATYLVTVCVLVVIVWRGGKRGKGGRVGVV